MDMVVKKNLQLFFKADLLFLLKEQRAQSAAREMQHHDASDVLTAE